LVLPRTPRLEGVAGIALIVGSLVYEAAVVRPREATLEAQLSRNEQARLAAEALRAEAVTEPMRGGGAAEPGAGRGGCAASLVDAAAAPGWSWRRANTG